MKKARLKVLISYLTIMALTISSFAVGPVNQISWADTESGGLIISEYIEGGSYNKAIELFNTSENDFINLEDYQLGKVGNGSGEPSYYDITGVVSPGAIAVFYNSKSAPELIEKANRAGISEVNSAINFNGDDPMLLVKRSDKSVVDYVGKMGDVDFGKDHTYIRKASVVTGQTAEHAFDNGEWNTEAKDYFEDLGIHSFDGIQPADKLAKVFPSVTDSVVNAGTLIELKSNDEGVQIYFSLSSDEKTDFHKYEQAIPVNEDMTLRAYSKKDGMQDSDVVVFEYKILKQRTIKEVRDNNGMPAIIEGVITAKIGSYDYYMQDDTAGIILSAYRTKGFEVSPGDRVRVQGEIEVYKTMSQIHPVAAKKVELLSSGPVPQPELVTCAGVNEDTEGELVTVENIKIDSVDSYGNYTVSDSSGTSLVLPSSGIALEVGDTYEAITGVVKYNYGYKIFTRDSEDILWSTTKVYPVKASMGDTTKVVEVEKNSKIALTSETDGAQIYYTVGADKSVETPTPETGTLYTGPITIDEDHLVIKAMAVKNGLESTPVFTFEYKLGAFVYIHSLQGASHTSPFVNQSVSNVKGIVTAISAKDSYQKGVYIQTPDENVDGDVGTSEGIFVNMADPNAVKVGDLVVVSGTVKEVKNGIYDPDNMETIIDGANVTVVSSNNSLPKATILGNGGRALIIDHIDNDGNTSYDPEEDALDFYESVEGMLVQVNNPVVVGMDERYGEFAVLADNGQASAGKRTPYGGIKATYDDHNPEIIHIDDVIIPIAGSQKTYYDTSYAPKVGDKFDGSIVGVMSFGFGKYKILNTSALPNLIDGGLEITNTDIQFSEDKLTIASFNIENFHKGVEADKIAKIAKTIAVQLKTPDVVAVIEMQDNNGAKDDGTISADENAAVLIEAINAALGTPVNYKYIDIAPVDKQEGGEPGGNIRVGYLYNADRVSLHEAPAGSNTADAEFKNGHLVNNPSRVATNDSNFASTRRSLATEFMFNGESVVVIANHLSSKRGDEGEFGPNQPPVKGSEPKRHGQAQAINDFIDSILSDTPDANVVVVGDLNDYEYSETVHLLKGIGDENVMTNMIDALPVNERMTYVHNGNSQVLDHILVSNNMSDKTEIDVVNANSMVTRTSGRSSDHDPLIIQMRFDDDTNNGQVPHYNNGDLLDRQMFMVLVSRMFGLEEEASTFGIPADFTDVNENDWFASYVWYAFYQGWTAGMGDGTFGVDQPVEAKQLAVFKIKAGGYEVPSYDNVLNQLKELGILWQASNMSAVTYGEALQLLNAPFDDHLDETVDITGVKTLDLMGSEKDTFSENDMVYVKVSVKNLTSQPAEGDLLINIKEVKSGIKTMKKFAMFPDVVLSADETESYQVGFETFGFELGVYDIEIYFWNSLSGQKPLAESETTQFEIQ